MKADFSEKIISFLVQMAKRFQNEHKLSGQTRHQLNYAQLHKALKP